MDIIKIKKAALINSNILNQEVRQGYHCTPMTGRKSNEAQAFVGGFCLVFPMINNVGSEKTGYRVWYLDNLNHQLLQIAKDVANELQHKKMPYFVGYQYLDEALNVDGAHIPGVRMDWVEGDTLDSYIKSHRTYSELKELADKFYTMCEDLSAAGIAHGDLSNSNILVTRSGEIRLVDYDSLYFPSMAGKGYKQTTTGQPAFQHSQRVRGLPMSANDDNFSQLVIYLSLRAIAFNLSLITDTKITDQELLFTNAELHNANQFRNSETYKAIRKIDDPVIKSCLNALENAIVGPLSSVPSIVEVLGETPKPIITDPIMHRNKYYCPECGTKFLSESSAYCSNCNHPREVPKTW